MQERKHSTVILKLRIFRRTDPWQYHKFGEKYGVIGKLTTERWHL